MANPCGKTHGNSWVAVTEPAFKWLCVQKKVAVKPVHSKWHSVIFDSNVIFQSLNGTTHWRIISIVIDGCGRRRFQFVWKKQCHGDRCDGERDTLCVIRFVPHASMVATLSIILLGNKNTVQVLVEERKQQSQHERLMCSSSFDKLVRDPASCWFRPTMQRSIDRNPWFGAWGRHL